MPDVSVVIPVRDCAAYIEAAVASALAQTVPPREVIVVDNGSTDASAALAAAFGAPVTVLEQLPAGNAPAARNAGVRHATGAALAFLDADDTWSPARLERGLEALGEADLVFGRVEELHSPELTAAQRAALPPARGVVPGRVITTLLVARATFDRVGPFDEDLRAADFLDWLARARALGLTERMLAPVLAQRRLHPGNTQWSSRPADLTRALRAALARRAAS